jgi:mono/diheme cytochrome c family protein
MARRSVRVDSAGVKILGTLFRAFIPSLVALANAAGGTTNVTSLEIRDTLHGHFVYMKNCVFCHGKRGDGKGEMGLTVEPRPRDFGAGVFKYRSTPSGTLPTNEDLTRIVREGIADTAMPIFDKLPARDVEAVIEYIKAFSPKWRRPENYAAPIVVPEKPAWFADAREFAKCAEKGRGFYSLSCAACHGDKGDGFGSVTNLVDSWGHPTPARDLRQPYIRSGKKLEDIYRVLVTGLDGTPMPSFAESTTEEQRWELVAFIEQLRREASGRTKEN